MNWLTLAQQLARSEQERLLGKPVDVLPVEHRDLPPKSKRPTAITLEVDDDVGVMAIAEALASKYMTVKWTGEPGKGRIVLTAQGLALKYPRPVSPEEQAGRDWLLDKGMEP